MIKKEIINNVSAALGLTKKETKAVFEASLFEIINSLASGEPVFIRGFGTFEIKTRAPKTARDIRNHKIMVVPARKTLKFKPCDALNDRISHLKA